MPSTWFSDSVDGEELNDVLRDDYDSDEEITWDGYDEDGSDEYTDFSSHPQPDLPLERDEESGTAVVMMAVIAMVGYGVYRFGSMVGNIVRLGSGLL
ncbi:hypothetical protein BDD12DRAFT_873161 [Trichophaea hybrida]|nr:hypothetical protein BDD12DRAFT_873161 [Trichophaea hybrida]